MGYSTFPIKQKFPLIQLISDNNFMNIYKSFWTSNLQKIMYEDCILKMQ